MLYAKKLLLLILLIHCIQDNIYAKETFDRLILFGDNEKISYSADIEVTGKVTDQTGLPLRGASVLVIGSNTGAFTNADGEYSITVAEDAVLVFSYIGFESKQIPVESRTVINVVLIDKAKTVGEVVVVGYGTQRKGDVTGSTSSIKGEELAKQPVLTATQALQGKAAGVQIISYGQPGKSPEVRVRGTNTALGGTKVLYVVDGVLTDDISNINTSDIVSMDILKDASATAIYGARGANGVVIITTKTGKTGPPRVSYFANVGIRQATNLVKMANAEEYSNYASAASGLPVPNGPGNTDWYDEILRTSFQQSHNVSLSGGGEGATYFLSVGYLEDEGIIIDNKFRRFTIRSNNDFRITDKIRVGVLTSYSSSKDDRVDLGAAYNNAYRAAPIIPSKVDGKYGNTSSYQNVGNPLLDIESKRNPVQINRLQGSGYIEFKPIKSITFRSSIGGDWNNENNKSYTYKFLNDTTTFLTFGGNQRNPNSNLTIGLTKAFRWVWDNTVTYNERFGKHNITVLAGTTAEQANSDNYTATKKDVAADPNLWYLSEGNENTSQIGFDRNLIFKYTRNAYLGRINYSYANKYLFTGSIRADGSSRFSLDNRWGYFPSAAIGWVISKEDFMREQKIFDNLKLRASWGRVGNDAIPSDAFLVTVTPNYNYAFGGEGTIAEQGSAIERIKDPDIKWETTTETDVAIEFTALNNRFTGEVNYYIKKTRDLLINVTVASTAGDRFQELLTNIASIQNRGVEVVLNWSDDIKKDLSYRIGGNVTFNKNTVIGLNGGQPIQDGGVASQAFTTFTDNGQPVGSFYVLKMIGIFQSEEEVENYRNSDGTLIQPGAHAGDIKYEKAPTADGKAPTGPIDIVKDRQFVGSYEPKFYYGINLGVTYKNFDLTIDAYGNAGNQVYNGKKAFRLSNGAVDNVESYQAYDRWTTANQSQTEPIANKGNLPASTYFIESGSFIRLNNVTLSYTLPSKLIERIKINSFRVFATGQNLYTYKKFSGFTPELPGSPLNSGIETNAYPTSRTYAVGVNVVF